MNDSFTCRICFELHTATAKPIDRRPSKICNEYDHLLCSTCAKYFDKCPTCQKPKKLELLKECTKIAAKLERLNSILNETGAPEIPAEYFKLAALPFASGSYADVYNVWQNQSIALKLLRRNIMTTDLSHKVLQETRSAMALSHPNIVRVFGVVSIDGSKGILMEKADRGSLRSALDATNKLSLDQLVSVSIDVVDCLEYVHSQLMIAHRDLKPENVLLFDVKSHLTSKIADFGTSKVIQSSLAGTDIVGTPYYTAPELLKPPRHELRYGWKVDLYSLSIVLYEVFSGRNIGDAFASVENSTQLLEYIESGQRPELPESFPTELRAVVERGWSSDANARSTLISFREALCRLKTSIRYAKPAPRPISGPNASAIIASSSTSTSTSADTDTDTDTDTDACATFEARLQELHQSVKAYKLTDARTQVAACASLFAVLRDRTTATASTAQYHSVKGYVHHWFGEYPDAYKETYQALTELYELSVSGVSVEGEQVGRILRYAVEVCEAQNWYKAMAVLLTYGVRFAKSKLSDEAYADMLECFCLSWHRGEKWNVLKKNISEFLLTTRLKASENKPHPHINVAIAHYHMAAVHYHEHLVSDMNYTSTEDHLNSARGVIEKVDANNIWAAACRSLEGLVKYQIKHRNIASSMFKDALKVAERVLGKNNHTVALILFRLGLSEEDSCEVHMKNAIDSVGNSLCPNSWLLTDALEHLADAYKDSHRIYEAEDLYLQSVEIQKDLNGPNSERISLLYGKLAETCEKSGQSAKAGTYSQLKSEVDKNRQQDITKIAFSAVEKQAAEVSKSLESGNETSEAPGELVEVLRKFFEVAPKLQLQTL